MAKIEEEIPARGESSLEELASNATSRVLEAERAGSEKRLGEEPVRATRMKTMRRGRKRPNILDETSVPIEEQGLPPAYGFPTEENTIWDVYNNEARIVDRELVKDWSSSLNSLLLFAAIFAAVLTSFIIESKKYLEQDPADVMVSVMIFYTNSVANGTHTPYVPIRFAPPSWAITVNCLLFASLSISIVAAFASVISLQWVAEYDAAITRGGASPLDRVKRRQFRFGGVKKWKMGEIIAALPMLLYLSVALFFAGVILWMWKLHKAVGCIVLGGAALALFFYFISTLLAVFIASAPFRTPLSRWTYSLFHMPYSLLYHVPLPILNSSREWLRTRRFSAATTQNRENQAVKEQKDLIAQGLAWLTTHISLSLESHPRLFLLLEEALQLDSSRTLSDLLDGASWWAIFEELGSHCLQLAFWDAITDIDVRTIKVLLRCLQNESLNRIIRGKNPDGDTDRDTERVNATYLLLQHIPAGITPDEEIKFRLLQLHYVGKVVREQFSWRIYWEKAVGHPSNSKGLQKNLLKALLECPHVDREYVEYGITGLLSMNGGDGSWMNGITLPQNNVLLCLLRSKHWIEWSCLESLEPYLMHQILWWFNRRARGIAMWRYVVTDEEVEERLGACDVHERADLQYIILAERSDRRLVEALHTFDNLVARGCTRDVHLSMIDLVCQDLQMHDSELYRGYYTNERKRALMGLRDSSLRLIACAASGIEWKSEWMYDLRVYPYSDSWEKASSYCCGSHSSLHGSSIWSLRVKLWAHLHISSTTKMIKEALRDFSLLVRCFFLIYAAPEASSQRLMEIGFHQPDLGIEHDGDQLLVALRQADIRTELWRGDTTLFTELSAADSTLKINLVLWLLLRNTGYSLPIIHCLGTELTPDRQCLEHFIHACRDIKADRGRLISLLVRITSIESNWKEKIATLHIMEQVISEIEHSSSSVYRDALARNLRLLRSEFNDDNLRRLRDPHSQETQSQSLWRFTVIIDRLEDEKTLSFGNCAKRFISCARAPNGRDAGTGWLGIHDGFSSHLL